MRKPKVEKRGESFIIKVAVDNPFAGGQHVNYSGYGIHVKNNNKHQRVNNRKEARDVQRGNYD